MSGTRRSARVASSRAPQNSSPSAQTSPNSTSKKRKGDMGWSPTAKRSRTSEKEQKSIEESMHIEKNESERPEPEKEDQQPHPLEGRVATNGHKDHTQSGSHEKPRLEEDGRQGDSKDANGELKSPNEKEGSTRLDQNDSTGNEGNAVDPSARDDQVPSSILEKGIIYFLYRGRVNIDDPNEVKDIARSYLLMRPLPHGAKLLDGPIGDESNCRLLAIPKKTFPQSGKDRWTAFVEKANASLKELKDGFLKADNYETSTQESRHIPAVTPAAEGVYAITTGGRESHLAYIVTIPSSLGEVQKDLGIHERGSFVTSVKNPKASGPAYADLGKDPGYSTEIMDEFRGLRWAPLQPKHLDYEGCQFLLIGEGDNGLDKATEPQKEDTEQDKEAPQEELEKLGGEDEMRVQHLNNEDAVFVDLGIDSKSYSSLQTTW